MADYTVVPANVLASALANKRTGVAGVTITAGQALYKDPADSTCKLADANAVTATPRTVEGLALNGAAAGQPIVYVYGDDSYAPGFSVAAGDVVMLSDTPGGLAPVADAVSGDYVTVVGVGIGNNKVKLAFISAGTVKP